MSWQGYIAVGNVASGVFTESSATNYARMGFSFNSSLNGKVIGFGPRILWTGVTGSITSYNSYAFFTASSGGESILVYPTPVPYYLGLNKDHALTPSTIVLNLLDGTTLDGLPLDIGGADVLAGGTTEPQAENFSNATGITALAGGAQTGATLLRATVNRVNTVATAGDSVMLPNSNPGAMVTVINVAANPLAVFPQSGDTINGQSANTSVIQNPSSVEVYWCSVAGAWHVEIGEGYSGSLFTESAQDNITAHAGGGKASATQITAQTCRVSTVATAGDSVLLPASAAGLELVLINSAANPMQVYGSGSDTIDSVATGTGVSQMPGSMCIYSCISAGSWYTNGLGTGYAGSLPTVSFTNAITAHAGGGQGSATPLTTVINRITTVGTAADSVVLPTAAPGLQITVINAAAANSANVFPATGDAINALGANNAFALAAGKSCNFYSTVAGVWHTILSA